MTEEEARIEQEVRKGEGEKVRVFELSAVDETSARRVVHCVAKNKTEAMVICKDRFNPDVEYWGVHTVRDLDRD